MDELLGASVETTEVVEVGTNHSRSGNDEEDAVVFFEQEDAVKKDASTSGDAKGPPNDNAGDVHKGPPTTDSGDSKGPHYPCPVLMYREPSTLELAGRASKRLGRSLKRLMYVSCYRGGELFLGKIYQGGEIVRGKYNRAKSTKAIDTGAELSRQILLGSESQKNGWMRARYSYTALYR